MPTAPIDVDTDALTTGATLVDSRSSPDDAVRLGVQELGEALLSQPHP